MIFVVATINCRIRQHLPYICILRKIIIQSFNIVAVIQTVKNLKFRQGYSQSVDTIEYLTFLFFCSTTDYSC